MYTKKDFNNLQFNPLCEGIIWTEYPILKDILGQLEASGETDRLMRYVILCYDPKSRLVMEEKDLNHRKGLAAEYAKLDTDEDFLKSVFSFSLKSVSELAMRYLVRFVRSKEWAAIVAIEYKYWENIAELTTPIQGETNKERLEAAQKKSIISDEVEKDIKRIDDLYKAFFGDDQFETAVKKQSFTAERIAFGG